MVKGWSGDWYQKGIYIYICVLKKCRASVTRGQGLGDLCCKLR